MEHLEHDWEQQCEQLSALLDNELDEQARAELEAHLPTCAQCRAELASLQRTRALVRAMPQPTLPRSFALPLEAASTPESARQAVPTPRPASTSEQQHASAPPARLANRRRPVQALQWLSAIAAVLGIVILLSGAFSNLSLGGVSNSAASFNNERPSASGGQPSSTPTSAPARTPNETASGHATPIPTPTVPGDTPGTPGTTGQTSPPGVASSSPFGALISTTGLGALLLVLGACGFAIAWALRRRW